MATDAAASASPSGGRRAVGARWTAPERQAPGADAPGTRRRATDPRRRVAHWSASLAVAGVLTALATVAGVVAWQVYEGQRLPDGPVPVVWGKEACAHCHMHLSEMRFAVQLQTRDGDVLNFDDPGCFFLYLAEERPEIHEVWFHHSRADRWLRRSEVGFVPAFSTPMNFGLAAVGRGEPGAITYEAARARLAARAETGS